MVGESGTVTSLDPQYVRAGEVTSGLELGFTLEYNRRITIDAGDICKDVCKDVVIPKPEKPWQERRKNNYKAKRIN